MKTAATILCLLISTQLLLGQASRALIQKKSDCAPVTQRIMEQVFTLDRQLELENSPEELACLDYLCSGSYEFEKGQTPLKSQKILFNIEKYKHLRRVDQRVTVYDEVSGLNVVLYSWNEVETGLEQVRSSYQLMSSK